MWEVDVGGGCGISHPVHPVQENRLITFRQAVKGEVRYSTWRGGGGGSSSLALTFSDLDK
jgi:hypothetical protein